MKKVSFAISYSLYLFFQGFLFPQPSISINQNSFSSALYTGDTEVQSMVLSNSGSEPLGWYLSINYIDDNFYRVNSFFYRNQEPHLRIEPVIACVQTRFRKFNNPTRVPIMLSQRIQLWSQWTTRTKFRLNPVSFRGHPGGEYIQLLYFILTSTDPSERILVVDLTTVHPS